MRVSYLVRMVCGKNLVVPEDPENPTKSAELLGHYIMGKAILCVECFSGNNGRKEKTERSQTWNG